MQPLNQISKQNLVQKMSKVTGKDHGCQEDNWTGVYFQTYNVFHQEISVAESFLLYTGTEIHVHV